MTISIIVYGVTGVFVAGVFGRGGGAGGSPPKNEEVLKKMVKQAGRIAQKTCRKDC